MYYAHKRFLVTVERAETDGFLDFGETIQPYFKGNIIASDSLGNQSVMTETYFHEVYIEVQKVEPKPKRKIKSPFEIAEIEEAYEQSWVNLEDSQYINGTYEISKNK